MRKSNENVDTGGSGINKYLIKELKNKNIVSNSVRIHHLVSLLSTFSQQVQIHKHCFKLRQNAPQSGLISILYQQLQL